MVFTMVLSLHTDQALTTHPTHIAFVDESYHHDGRYRGLGVVSLRYCDYQATTSNLAEILKESGIKEFKWNKLKSARERLAALKLIKYAIDNAACGSMRFDILIWDIEDSRHKISKRDDIANLHRMYHHLLKNVLRQRWPNESTWLLRPDENCAMQWNDVGTHLERFSHTINPTPNLLKPYRIIDLIQNYQIHDIQPAQSDKEPLVQLVDLLTGLAVYSRINYLQYDAWQEVNNEQLNLFAAHHNETKMSAGDKERCTVLRGFHQQCEAKKLGISLQTTQGLRTHNPQKPINFWWYTPQHALDKAPVKSNSRV